MLFGGALAVATSCAPRPLQTIDSLPAAASGGLPVDPVSSIPKPSDRTGVTEGVATLRTPVSVEAVMALVRRWFEAFHAKSIAGIEGDIDDPVADLFRDGEPGRARIYFLSDLTSRMKSVPFDQIDVDQVYRPQDVEVWARDELGLPGRPSRPSTMQQDDLLVRIPIATPRVGADVLFGDEIRLLLRRDGARYKIRGYGEQVPK